MSATVNVPHVGAADPELQNSPVADELDEEYEVIKQEVPGEAVCYFNAVAYGNDQYVCSGTTLLRCNYGVWLRCGTCDPDNP